MAAELIGEAFISGAIQLLLERIASPEVVSYFLGNSKDSDSEVLLLKRLKTMASSLAAVLDDAEQRQIRNDPRVEAWLDEVQEAVFDADDLLDEIETDALQLKVVGESSSGRSEVREAKRRKIFSLFSWSRNSSEGDLESKITKVLDRLEEIAKEKDLLGLKENFFEEKRWWQRWQRLPSTSLVEESEIYGRDDDKDALIKLLVSDGAGSEKICVIPIVGMGGVGKTTLAQAVFNHFGATKHFDLMCWVCVSEKFDVCRVTCALLQSECSCSSHHASDLNSLQVKLREKLDRKKFLIVLDDVWNEKYVDWEVMRMPFKDGARGSKIIVTTRSEEVASIMGTRTIPTHHLNVLTEEAAWKLFAKHAFGNFTTDPDLERIGRKIVKKCKGLPLAVKTLGGLLRYKLDIDHWEGILKSEIWELTHKQSDILPALRLSYHYLPSHLKRCFAYCSIFPKDYEFHKEELILLWMAENLLEQPKGNRSMEEVGDQYFNHLVSRSFFQRSTTIYRSCFVMHDLIVDLANFVSGEYCSRIESEHSYEAVTQKTRYLACIGNRDVICERFNSILKSTRVRTFLLLKSKGPYHVSKELVHDFFVALKYLRVLSLFGHHGAKQLIDSVCELRHLRFLNLSYASINSLPNSICTLYNLQTLKVAGCPFLSKLPKDFHHLVNLRYLDASYTMLEELPESLGLLVNLQKLMLLQCLKLTELPNGLHRLINLRYLNVKGSGLKEMPTNISELKSLQTLSTFVVGKDSGANIRELGKLLNLRGTLCIKNLQNVVKTDDALETKLREKKYLEKLEFEWASRQISNSIQEMRLLDNLEPHTSLKRLEITGYGGTKFPNWLGHQSFCNTVEVYLSDCNHCVTLPPLGQLSSLRTLRIERFSAVVNVSPGFYGNSSSVVKPFASLEVLEFNEMSKWKEWSMPNGDVEAFPKLMVLSLKNCNILTGDLPCFFPSLNELTMENSQQFALSLQRIPNVTKLSLVGCSENIIRSMEALESSSFLQHLTIVGNSLSVQFRHLPTSLKTLRMCSESSFELQFPQQSHDSLEELFIECYDGSFRSSFALDNFPNIKTLRLEGCENPKSLWVSSNGLSFESLKSLSTMHISDCLGLTLFPSNIAPLPSLTSLELKNCKELKSLPEQMHNLFPSLESLDIIGCLELESFPISGLPSSLRRLYIAVSDKLMASRKNWNLCRLPNLTNFKIWITSCEDIESFPEEDLLPSSVTQLKILCIKYLKGLDKRGLEQLTSLKQLTVQGCPNLQTMPDEGLPASLLSLAIIGCPLLEEKCKRETGEYWNKIAHIPHIEFDF